MNYNESVAPCVGLSRAIPLLPFYAFVAHHRENFTFTSTTFTTTNAAATTTTTTTVWQD